MRPLSFPLAIRFVTLIVVPLLAGAWWLHRTLHESVPPTSSLLLTTGVSAQVRIERDEHGVPHIHASSDADAYFAVGYVHAQDRLWQMDVQRRVARGRMAEIFGKESIESDVWFRTLGLYGSAQSALAAISAPARDSLKAYADGVNAWIAQAPSLPIEFRLLGVQPEPWTELDSLVWIKMFALDLSGNFRRESSRFVASQVLEPKQLEVFFPGYPPDAPITAAGHEIDGLARLTQLQDELERHLRIGGRYVGSNAWAVSGRHTADGAALLANDPHLGLQIPSLWYAVSVDAPTFRSVGMGLVGLPMVVFGRNENIGWGGTNMMADTQDLYFEHSDAGGLHYRVGEEWQAFAKRMETIDIRAEFPASLRQRYEPVRVQVRSTRHGPVISDQFAVFEQPVALRWTALEPGDTSYEAIYRLNFAANWSEFKTALELHVAPAMNMVYADRHGNIGYLATGRVPIRSKGDGTMPAPGWTDEYAWRGYIPPSHLPQEYNPESGYIVSANNKIVDDAYPYFISHDWAPPARARRIQQMLEERIARAAPLTLADMEGMQADTIDLDTGALWAELAGFQPVDDAQARAMALLKGWDGDMRGESAAAMIFHTWMFYLRDEIFADELRGYWNRQGSAQQLRALVGDVGVGALRELLENEHAPWCNDVATPGSEDCQDMLRLSLQRAIRELGKLNGDAMESWRWQDVQRTTYAHVPFSRQKLLAAIFERRIGNGGSENTVNVAAGSFAGAEGYLQGFGAGFRQVMALGRSAVVHRYMNSTGQSGNVASDHYDDMVEPFNRVEYYPLGSLETGAKRPGDDVRHGDTK